MNSIVGWFPRCSFGAWEDEESSGYGQSHGRRRPGMGLECVVADRKLGVALPVVKIWMGRTWAYRSYSASRVR